MDGSRQQWMDRMEASAPAWWIWSPSPEDQGDTMAQFLLEFQWDGTGQVCWVGFADALYTLWCNGQVLGVGPVTGSDDLPYLTHWDLAGKARPGRNVLALQVWGHAGRKDCNDISSLENGLIGWLRAGSSVIATGADWKARAAQGYTNPSPDGWRPFMEGRLIHLDARKEPLDWMMPDYEAPQRHGWAPARCLHPRAHPGRKGLRMSPIPPMSCESLSPIKALDAGLALGDSPVKHVADVADRMIAQEHESLLCPQIELGYPFSKVGDGVAKGRADPSRLGWSSLRPPFECPQVESGQDFYLALDVGRMSSGCLLLEVETAQECRIDVGYADHLRKGRVDPTIQFRLADRVIVGPGRSPIRLPHDRGCRYVQLSLSAGATLHDVRWEEHVYRHDRARRFDSSSPGLNAIWQAACDTVRSISTSFYCDNTRRERQSWVGTELINAWKGGWATCGDLALGRKHIVEALEAAQRLGGLVPCKVHGNCPPEWLRQLDAHDLCVPQTFDAYLLHSDDSDLAPRMLEAARKIIEHHSNFDQRGLKGRIGSWCWTGWTFNAATSVITSHNLLLIEAMRATARLYRYCGKEQAARLLLEKEGPLVEAIFRELIDPDRQVLCQGLDTQGRRVPFCSQHDNALALRLGIVGPDRIDRFHRFAAGASGTWPTNRSAWQGSTTRGDSIRYHPQQPVAAGSPWDSLVAIDAMAQVESPQAVLDYIRFNFGAMVDEGEGTLWECWNQHHIVQGTSCYSQGWGSAVAYRIIQYVLGAQLLRPGGSEIRWRPRRVDLKSCRGMLRTPHGEVELGWREQALRWRIPAGVELFIEEPDGRPQVVQGPSEQGGQV